ncbi:hypothetical protein GGI43DRAFT_54997 [Trichoderma evansii]
MHIPDVQKLATASLALASATLNGDTIIKGSVLDFAVEKCVDKDGNLRCSKPFAVKADGCIKFEWSTDGALSHTTVEVRDAGSGEIVYYRDTNGEWEPKKNELVYLDFKPKIMGQGNKTVDYEVKNCEKDEEL